MYQPIKRATLALCLSLFCFFAFAQKTITGTVKDVAGDPLIGATVSLGGANGVITDIDGNFILTNVSSGATMTISYIGYQTKTVKVGNQNAYAIVLEANDKSLDEVVVVGYGTMKRRDLTGAVASVTGEKLSANPVSTVAEALQGQLPGVNVISQDGRPGGSTSIRVRGGGSITQSNEPLFVVDGVIVSSIDDIPADNIESIDVLKDAASTAIYGSAGANGVILITTKGAKEGKVTVRYNAYYQVKTNPANLDVMDPYDHVLHQWSYATALGSTYADNVAKFYGLGSKYGNHINEYKNQSAHNYMDDVLHTGHAWNHDASISGGSEHTKYYGGLSFTNDKGILINSGFRRWSANFKLTQDITKNLQWTIDARYNEMQFNGSQYGYATQAYTFNPIDNPLGTGDPSDLGMGSANAEAQYNPLAVINDYENLRQRQRVGVNNALTWKILKGLVAKSELYLGRNWSQSQTWQGGKTNGQSYNLARLSNSNGYNTRWDTTLSYDVQGLGDSHKLNVMVGNELRSTKTSMSSDITGTGYPAEWGMDEVFANLSSSDPNVTGDGVKSSIGEPDHRVSWFGRLNYTLLERYLFTLTFRADGSSRFGQDNKWGYFPAAAAAWRISDEPFFENSHDWLDNLKLRLSYGLSGNDNIDQSLFKTYWESGTAVINGQNVTIYKPSSCLGNNKLKWETTVSRNIGLDFGFARRVRGSLEIYWNTTKDVLMRVPCDPSTGFSYQGQNIGQTSNKGIELSLAYDIIKSKDFNLNFGMTINHNKNNVDKLMDNAIASAHTGWGSTMRIPYYDYFVTEGEPVGLIQGMKSIGFYTVDDFDVVDGVWTLKSGVPDCTVGNYVGSSYYKIPSTQKAFPGMAKFEDTDNNGTVTTDDATIIGRTQPTLTGGFNFNGNYKSFDFSANFTYQLGGDVYNANVMHSMMGNKDTALGQGRLATVSDCWRMFDVDNSGELVAVTDPAQLAALNANAKYALPFSEYGITTSEFIEDASYLRLQTLTLGYTLPQLLTQKAGISRLRLYVTAGNLFCLKKYSGLDPDVNVSPSADSSYSGFPTPAYDFRSYPKSRTFTFGLNVTF